jgi:CheY-like chemotaxis protein
MYSADTVLLGAGNGSFGVSWPLPPAVIGITIPGTLARYQRRFCMPSTIMCIDDRPQVLALRKAKLETQGYAVLLASSGYDGIRILQKTPADAVLLEYKEEGIDAEAVAFHIKERFPDLPIILLSAYSAMSERILWLVDEYVMKSAPLEELVQIIERAMQLTLRKAMASEIPPAARRHAAA